MPPLTIGNLIIPPMMKELMKPMNHQYQQMQIDHMKEPHLHNNKEMPANDFATCVFSYVDV